jgi:hypothetical protein
MDSQAPYRDSEAVPETTKSFASCLQNRPSWVSEHQLPSPQGPAIRLTPIDTLTPIMIDPKATSEVHVLPSLHSLSFIFALPASTLSQQPSSLTINRYKYAVRSSSTYLIE